MSIEIYVVPSDDKVRREQTEMKFVTDEIRLDCAVGGHHSAQLILRTDQADGEKFCVHTEDFRSEKGQKIPAGRLSVYSEHFAEVNVPTRNNRYIHPLGYYPDALIPFKTAEKYGENYVFAGENSALYLSFDAAGCNAGEYDSAVEICTAEGTKKIPIKLKIYSADISARHNLQTMFLMRENFIEAGEGEKNAELLKKYYDFFLSYRITPYTFPVQTENAEEFADWVDRYYDRAEFTGYGFPSQLGGGAGIFDFEKFRRQILALAARSVCGRNLLEKAFVKNGDEPEENGCVERLTEDERAASDFLKRLCDEIEADDDGRYAAFKSNPNWRKSIENMQIVVPFSKTWTTLDPIRYPFGKEAKLLQSVNGWCPKPVAYDLQYRAVTEELHEKYQPEGKKWWYLCNDPVYPYPSYHIDDGLLGARLLSYMQFQCGITGNLYWSPVCFTDNCRPMGITKYDQPYRAGGIGCPAGEGFLVYPGKPYGNFGPLPSMRIETIRGGMEDYELLNLYREKISAFCKSENEKTPDEKSVIDTFLNRVLCGTQYYEDLREAEKVRRDILREVSAFEKADFHVTQIKHFGDRGKIVVYTRNGLIPKGNFVAAKHSEWTRYEGEIFYGKEKNYLEFENSEEVFFLSPKRLIIGKFDRLPADDEKDASRDTEVFMKNGNAAFTCTYKFPGRDRKFIPGVSFRTKYFQRETLDLKGSKYFRAVLRLESAPSENVQIVFYAADGYFMAADTFLIPGRETELYIRTDRIEWSKLSRVIAVGIQFGTGAMADGEKATVVPIEFSVVY